mmetsp:Transcript_6249/g.10520  ORF Transcript_6249/g.10520 Transcript_6249/m.10520 type:complete len:219 (-) Transcript_6249:1007-1663(-)
MQRSTFHSKTDENGDLNQYWYSEKTCLVLCAAVKESISLKGGGGARVAFLSTPSLFFSLDEEERKQCVLFDFDRSLSLGSCSSQFEFYDYNDPTNIDAKLHGKFDVSYSRCLSFCTAEPLHLCLIFSSILYPKVIVIDPPFISQSVWENYATTAALLGVKDGAHIICTTVEQNEGLMERLFKCNVMNFQPSIPKLIYQYNTYANFQSATLSTINPELE